MLGTKLLTYDTRISTFVRNKTRSMMFKDKVLLAVVITNLLSALRKDLRIVYSRDWNKVPKNSKRKFTARQVIKCVDFLAAEGYVINTVGVGSKIVELREPSTIEPTEKFLQEFNASCTTTLVQAEQAYLEASQGIVLRDSNKEDMEFKMTPELEKMKKVVLDLNQMNHKHNILSRDGLQLSNIYTRVFNESFAYGGRFYRADILQMHHKDDAQRLDVTIDGKKVVEVDYQNLHFRIAAVNEGVDMSKIPLDMYADILIDPFNKLDRRIIKLAVNIMFNAYDRDTARYAIQSEINRLSKADKLVYTLGNAESVLLTVEQSYELFTELFYMDDSYGRILQNMDSNLASAVLEVFIKQGIPILCVHDSFIVEMKYMDLLCRTMSGKFREVFSTDCDVPMSVKWKDTEGEVLEKKIII